MFKCNYLAGIIITLAMCLTAPLTAFADFVHVVNRGETIHSIAQKYGLSTDQILKANPQASQYVYVGMELTIPAQETTTPSQPTAPQQPLTPQPSNTGNNGNPPSSNSNYGELYSHFGFSYLANFSDNGKGCYGIYWETLSASNVGIFSFVGASYGITDPGRLHYRIGPNFGGQLGENTFWSIPVTFNLLSGFENIKEIRYSSSSSKYSSGTPTTESGYPVFFGIAAMPKIVLKVDRVHFDLGLDINYTFQRKLKTKVVNHPLLGNYTEESKAMGKAYVGFFVGIGI